MHEYEEKKLVSTIAIYLLFGALFLKLFQMQVLDREEFQKHSFQNRIRQIRILPPRGQMVDRNGKVIVENQASYALYVVPFEARKDSVVEKLTSILQDSTGVIEKRLKQGGNSFTALKVRDDLSMAQVTEIEEMKLKLPGVSVRVEPKRYYPSSASLAHVLGYLSEASKTDIEEYKSQVKSGDWVGKRGIEKKYQSELLGTNGYNFVEVNSLGREIADGAYPGESRPRAGKQLDLTIDLGLQCLAESLFVDKQGGVIMLDCRNGDVLVMCSKPDYDPNMFAKRITPQVWDELVNDPRKPLYDRMVQGEFPPGSTFKLVTLTAALETGKAKPTDRYTCTGSFRFGRRVFHCWNHSGHGSLDMLGAIMHSCNVYMYNTSLKLEVDEWAEYADRFGFGQPTGIDLPGERKGNLPNKAYLDKVYGEKGWTRAMMLNLGIGQGDLLVTPLQMARFAMILANRGTYYTPHLVQKIVDPDTKEFSIFTAASGKVEGISDATWDVLRQGMYNVVNAPGGTGRASSVAGQNVAGKTGTAQNPHGDSHAWFIGFAPYDHPRVAFCVLVENGGSGSGNAAPIAGKLLRKYFSENVQVAALSTANGE